MVLLLTILTDKGEEFYSYQTKYNYLIPLKSEMRLDFFNAILTLKHSKRRKINSMNLANIMVYYCQFNRFYIFLLFSEVVTDSLLDDYFTQIISILSPYKPSIKLKSLKTELDQLIQPILDPYLEERKPQQTFELTSNSLPIKIAFAGLGNAGKTSLKRMFFEKWTKEMVRNIQPTVGIEIKTQFLDYLQDSISIYDFGGQFFYREESVKDISKWANLTILIFVIDIQDLNSLKTAKRYFSDIINILQAMYEKLPNISIFFHKCDPEIQTRLRKNITLALEEFNEFSSIVSFHFTTIEDERGNFALIKTLYYSCPRLLIRRILQDKFFPFFEHEILVHYLHKSLNIEKEKIRENIYEKSISQGIQCAYGVQRDWLSSLIINWNPLLILRPPEDLTIGEDEPILLVSMKNYSEYPINKQLVSILLHGFLTGIVRTFHLNDPIKLKMEMKSITFQIDLLS